MSKADNTTRFTQADLTLFALASRDYNPLHLCSKYARNTHFGQQVVYGILGAVACLGKIQAPAGQRCSSISLHFDRPMVLDVDYSILVNGKTLRLMDGSTQLLRAEVEFCPGEALSTRLDSSPDVPRSQAACLGEEHLLPGLMHQGTYQPNEVAAAALMERFGVDSVALGTYVIDALLWSSYLAGMEVPGERALYFKLDLRLPEEIPARGLFSWRTQLISKNAMNVLRSSFQLKVGSAEAGEGMLSVMLRPNKISLNLDGLLTSESLAGKVALVIGASRGLGASIASALALRGATVLVNYLHGDDAANSLSTRLNGHGNNIVLVKGDASDPEWCSGIRAKFGAIDFLVLNACPTVRPMMLESETLPRMHAYIDQAFSLVSTPLAVFAGHVKAWTVLISSVYVETTPKQFPHYVAVKAATEAFLRAAAQQYQKPGYLIVRPPKLRTDMTNTPFGASDAIAPELLAASLVNRLQAPARPGQVEVLGPEELGLIVSAPAAKLPLHSASAPQTFHAKA